MLIEFLSNNNLTDIRSLATYITLQAAILYKATNSLANVFTLENVQSSFVNNLKESINHFRELDE